MPRPAPVMIVTCPDSISAIVLRRYATNFRPDLRALPTSVDPELLTWKCGQGSQVVLHGAALVKAVQQRGWEQFGENEQHGQ